MLEIQLQPRKKGKQLLLTLGQKEKSKNQAVLQDFKPSCKLHIILMMT